MESTKNVSESAKINLNSTFALAGVGEIL